MWAWLDSGVNIFSYLNFCYKVTTEHLFCAKHPAEGLMGPIPTPVYEEFSLYHQAIIQYQLGVLQFNSIQTLHTGDSLRFHKNSPLQMPFPSPGYHLYFWPTGCKAEVPNHPLLGFDSFAKMAHRTQETRLLIWSSVYYKGSWRIWPDREIHMVSSHTKELCPPGVWGLAQRHVEVFRFPSPETLQALSLWVLLEGSLHRHNWFHLWPQAIDLTSSASLTSRNQAVGVKVQPSVPLATSHHP